GMHSGRGGCGVGSDLTTLIGAGGLLFRARWCAGLGAGPLPAMVILLVMFLVICHSASPREALRDISERLVDFSGARAPEDPQKPRETPRDATEMYPTDGRQLCDETKFRTRVRPERLCLPGPSAFGFRDITRTSLTQRVSPTYTNC